jgi:hypothetical protein
VSRLGVFETLVEGRRGVRMGSLVPFALSMDDGRIRDASFDAIIANPSVQDIVETPSMSDEGGLVLAFARVHQNGFTIRLPFGGNKIATSALTPLSRQRRSDPCSPGPIVFTL